MTIKTDAQAALAKSDITVIRCYETGTQVTEEVLQYRTALREIIRGDSSGPLPSAPDYPIVTPSQN